VTAPEAPLTAKPNDDNAAVKRTITTPSAGFRRRLPARRIGGRGSIVRVCWCAVEREVHVADLGSVFIGCRGSGPGFGLRPGRWEVAMTTTPIVRDRELVRVVEPLFSDGERAALAGFLTGYSGLTREA